MNGMEFIAGILAAGRFHGIGIGSSIGEVGRALPIEGVDVVDDGNLSLRRDVGLVELYFADPPEWVVTGGSVEVHRLAADPRLADEWRERMQVDFPRYISWADLAAVYAGISGAPALKRSEQGGYVEYRAVDTKVSVLVVDGNDVRDDWPGHGDVWSVSMG